MKTSSQENFLEKFKTVSKSLNPSPRSFYLSILFSIIRMLIELLQSSYFSIFLIVALGFMLGLVTIIGLSLDVSAVIFIALAFGHCGVSIPKELGTFGLVLFIFTIGIQAGPGFFHSFRSKGKTLILITLLIVASACLTGVGMKYLFKIDPQRIVGLIAGAFIR